MKYFFISLLIPVCASLLWGQETDTETATEAASPTQDASTIQDTPPVQDDISLRRLDTVRVTTEGLSAKRAFNAETAAQLPGSGGDALASIRAFPGVAAQSPLSTSILVRGSSASDTSYRFNDIVIGAPFHDVFLLSVFPTEVLTRILFYPGGYPATYENVQGGVIDIESKGFYDYPDDFSLRFSLTPIGATLSYSQEFFDRVRITLGGRGSFVESYAAATEAILGELQLVANAYDTHFLLDWQIDDTRGLHFFFLTSLDTYRFFTEGSRFAGRSMETLFSEERLDSSYGFQRFWDSEALRYTSEQAWYSNTLSLSRYSETYRETNYTIESYRATNETYSLRNAVDLPINSTFTVETYAKYSLDRAVGTQQVHPDGLTIPNIDIVETNAFTEIIAEYNNALTNENQLALRNRFALGGTLITTLPEFIFNTGAIFYVSDLSEERVNGDFRLRATYLPRLKKGALEIFGYGGRFIQYPDLVVPDTNVVIADRRDDQLFFQNDPHRTPFTYQVGAGTLWNPGGVEFSLEGYGKFLREQLVENPTYDPAHPRTNGNFPTVNYANGTASGLELQIRSTQVAWFTGLLSYSYGIARTELPQTPITRDQAAEDLDLGNNGLDYEDFTRVTAPILGHSDHVIKAIVGVGLSRSVRLGFRLTASSGAAYTPRAIGYDSLLSPSSLSTADIESCLDALGTLGCDFGVWIEDTRQLNRGNLPWSVNLDLRIDWTYFKNAKFEGRIYLDLLSFHTLFYQNITGYRYDARASGTLGDGEVASVRSPIANDFFIPLLGVEFIF